MPLAIVTASLVADFAVDGCVFVNNTALTGSLFLMNVSGAVRRTNFSRNEAVQGAGIFAVGSDVAVAGAVFAGNSAVTSGGAAALNAGNASFEDCEFSGNAAPEGGAIAAKEMLSIAVVRSRVKRNNSTKATFLNVDTGETRVALVDVEVDDDFAKAVVVEHPHLVRFENAKFNCRLRCKAVVEAVKQVAVERKIVSQATQTKDDWDDVGLRRSSTGVLWMILPVVLGILVLTVIAARSKRVRKIFRRWANKGTHVL
jgi:hypothetical protein